MALNLSKQAELKSDSGYCSKVGQAVYTAAIAIANEPPEMPYHRERLALARMVIVNWGLLEMMFLMAVTTQLTSPTPTDRGISNGVAAVWDVIALAMFPVSE